MVLNAVADLGIQNEPLQMVAMPDPLPGTGEALLKVKACGVCHTELDEIEGRTPPQKFPVIPGHQVVGVVEKIGEGVTGIRKGDRVGVAWIFSSCGHCSNCIQGNENLCSEFKATGRDVNGGYASHMIVQASSVFQIPPGFSDEEAAPLLCAGAIGYRSLKLTGLTNGQALGLTGFGASAHLVLKMVRHKFPDTGIYVFARNEREQQFAMELGARWAGDTTADPGVLLDCIIDTTPVWKPVVEALKRIKPGGRLVINAIRKEDGDKEYLMRLDYQDHLWLEKEIKSVANVARSDVKEFLELAAAIPIIPETEEYKLEDANVALLELKRGKIRGAKVLKIS